MLHSSEAPGGWHVKRNVKWSAAVNRDFLRVPYPSASSVSNSATFGFVNFVKSSFDCRTFVSAARRPHRRQGRLQVVFPRESKNACLVLRIELEHIVNGSRLRSRVGLPHENSSSFPPGGATRKDGMPRLPPDIPTKLPNDRRYRRFVDLHIRRRNAWPRCLSCAQTRGCAHMRALVYRALVPVGAATFALFLCTRHQRYLQYHTDQ